MTTREELLILARLQDEATRPVRDLTGELDRLHREINQGEKVTREQRTELRKLGSEMKRAQRDARDLSERYRDLGDRMTRWVSLPIVAAYGAMSLAASRQTEQLSRSNVVFGENAARIQRWAQSADRAMGLSTRAALENAAGFGNMFTQLGIGLDQATLMSQSLVGLSADIASFADVAGGAAEVNETFAAAFRGEFDSVQRFIPQIRAATVEQRAYAMGLAETGEELTDQAKALATYQLILEGAGAATGDFRRTQDSAANAVRVALATYENAGAELGENLLPYLAQGAQVSAAFAEGINELPEGIQLVVLGLGGMTATAGPMATLVGHVVQLRTNLALSQALGQSWAVGMTASLTRITAAAAGAGIAVAGLSMAYTDVLADAQDLVRSISGGVDLTDPQDVADTINELIDRYNSLRDEANRSTAVGLAQMLSPFNDNTVQRARQNASAVADEIERLQLVYDQLTAAPSTPLEGMVDEAERLERSLQEINEQYDRLVGRTVGVAEAQLRTRDTIRQIAEDLSAGGNSLDEQLRMALTILDVVEQEVTARQRAGEIEDTLTARLAAQQELLDGIGRMLPLLNDDLTTLADEMSRAATMAGLAEAFAAGPPLPGRGGRVTDADIADILAAAGMGDTNHPMSTAARNGGSTLAAWGAIDSMVPGSRTVTSFTRTIGLGSPDSDHHPSRARALDVQGSNLPATAAMVRRLGGFAEMHGAGPGRHLHVVPPTAPPAAGRAPSTINVPVTVYGHLHASELAGLERAVERAARRARREEAETGW